MKPTEADILGEDLDQLISGHLLDNETLYRILLDNLPQKMFMKDRNSIWVSGNANMLRDLGLSAEELAGKSDRDLFPQELADKYTADDQRIMESGKTEEIEEKHIQDGQETWVNTIKTPVRNNQGRVIGIQGISSDITTRKRVEEQLLTRSRITDLFLTVPDDEMYSEVLNVVLEVMKSPFGVFGYLDETGAFVIPSMTHHVWDECGVADKSHVFPRQAWGDGSWVRAIQEKKSNFSNEVSTKTPAGHVEVRRHVSFPILLRNDVIGLLQVANKETDYTNEDVRTLETISDVIAPVLSARLERERLVAARQLVLSDLKRSNEELEQFAYVASHDLQEPLRMVASYTQLLAQRYKDRLDEDANEFIEFAVDGAKRMQRLIDDLLTYSRVSSWGRPQTLIDPHAALGRAIANLEMSIEENQALVTNSEMPRVLGDEPQLVQLFQNLIGNALKFKGGEAPHIQVSAREEGRECVFSVRDNGIGIAPEYFERIFQIFRTLQPASVNSSTGIGLALCKRIVERHGGRIWVESAPGEGSTFHFTLSR